MKATRMNLGTDILAALPSLRAAAESRMTETIVAGTFTDGVAEDGSPTRVPVDVLYEGRGRIRYDSLAVSARDGAGSPVAAQTPFLSIPVQSASTLPGDDTEPPVLPNVLRVLHEGTEVLVSDSTVDAALVGRVYRVTGNPVMGQVTASRYPLEETS